MGGFEGGFWVWERHEEGLILMEKRVSQKRWSRGMSERLWLQRLGPWWRGREIGQRM